MHNECSTASDAQLIYDDGVDGQDDEHEENYIILLDPLMPNA